MRIAIAQIAPVLLDKRRTLDKVVARIDEAAARSCALVCFGEALVPGYPVWLDRADGARFEDEGHKTLHARYAEESVDVEAGDLDGVRDAARRGALSVVLGIIERPADRGGHSLYCTRVFIGANGEVLSTHRKLMPTHEERLAWSPGDGAGLVTHGVGDFTVGALLCWENWMPLARTALYAAGEDLHVALWPGCVRNTIDMTRFQAREGRSFVIASCGLLRGADVPDDVPLRERFAADPGEIILNGGSCIAGPDGSWIVEPLADEEALIVADLDHDRVRRERMNFDPVGHYARPDVLRLVVDRTRQGVLEENTVHAGRDE